jgi:hypothetical protein
MVPVERIELPTFGLQNLRSWSFPVSNYSPFPAARWFDLVFVINAFDFTA